MFTKSFTDIQGTTHTDAFFVCASANSASNNTERYQFNAVTKEPSLTERNLFSVSYEMYYWINEQAYKDGKPPYKLSSDINNTSFNISDIFFTENPDYSSLTLVEKAEKHCETQVLID